MKDVIATIRERVLLKFSAVSRTPRKKNSLVDPEIAGVIVMSLTALFLVAAFPKVREAMLDTFDKIFDVFKSLVGG